MNNAFGNIPEDVLNYARSQDEMKRKRAKQLKAREEIRRQREDARNKRPKKTWGNFLS